LRWSPKIAIAAMSGCMFAVRTRTSARKCRVDFSGPSSRGKRRLEVANKIASAENPFTARVMVNRIWKHHFGNGLVKSTDNFGKMGEAPSNQELLDYLASEFVRSGWSVKAMHRKMVLSNAYRMAGAPRRLEAEAVRDAVLTVAGSLDPKLYGPSVPPHISSYQDGRGKPESGPLDGAGRRSIYIQVRRNFLTPMFLAFRLSGSDYGDRYSYRFDGSFAGADDDEQRVHRSAGGQVGFADDACRSREARRRDV
jgi:hypothetical protein